MYFFSRMQPRIKNGILALIWQRIWQLSLCSLLCATLNIISINTIYAQTSLPLTADMNLRPNAPSRYIVQEQDSLWDVAGKFISNPWQAGEYWTKQNLQIHPGDELQHQGNFLNVIRNRTLKLSPNIRVPRSTPAIKVIPMSQIRQFLNRPLIVEADELETAPYVLANTNGKVLLGKDDLFYARGLEEDPEYENYLIVKAGQVYRDPVDGDHLANEAIYLGEAKLLREGEIATLEITASIQEIRQGDRLIPMKRQKFERDFLPHSPDNELDEARIIAVVKGISQIGQFQVVVINKGEEDEMERGHVLAIYRGGEMIRDNVDKGNLVKLPNIRAGTILLFKVFEKISFALVMDVSRTIYVNDEVNLP